MGCDATQSRSEGERGLANQEPMENTWKLSGDTSLSGPYIYRADRSVRCNSGLTTSAIPHKFHWKMNGFSVWHQIFAAADIYIDEKQRHRHV